VAEREAEERLLKLLGLLPSDSDLRELLGTALREEVGGYYSPRTGALSIVGDSGVGGLEDRITLAHELTHALEDQHYDLLAVQKKATSADQAIAIRAVIEGSAMVTTLQILRRQGGIGKAKEEAALAAQSRAKRVRQAPTFVQMQLLLPYTLGFSFLLRGKPWEILFDGVRIADIEQAYADPPRSTREVLHPEQYWGGRRDETRPLTLPDLSPKLGPGWERKLVGSIGELGLTLLTGSEVRTGGPEMILPTRWITGGATGTAGDVFHHYVNGERKVTLLLTRWESVRDADEFQRTLRGGPRSAFRFGANLLLLMGDLGDRAEPLALESAKSVRYWAGE
jgi:hypothetical protein